MNEQPNQVVTPSPALDPRERLRRADLALPAVRVKTTRESSNRQETRIPTGTPVQLELTNYLAVKGQLHQRLLDELDAQNRLGIEEEELEEIIREFVDEAIRSMPPCHSPTRC